MRSWWTTLVLPPLQHKRILHKRMFSVVLSVFTTHVFLISVMGTISISLISCIYQQTYPALPQISRYNEWHAHRKQCGQVWPNPCPRIWVQLSFQVILAPHGQVGYSQNQRCLHAEFYVSQSKRLSSVQFLEYLASHNTHTGRGVTIWCIGTTEQVQYGLHRQVGKQNIPGTMPINIEHVFVHIFL